MATNEKELPTLLEQQAAQALTPNEGGEKAVLGQRGARVSAPSSTQEPASDREIQEVQVNRRAATLAALEAAPKRTVFIPVNSYLADRYKGKGGSGRIRVQLNGVTAFVPAGVRVDIPAPLADIVEASLAGQDRATRREAAYHDRAMSGELVVRS